MKIGTKVKIVKGCKARQVDKGTTWGVVSVTEMGADYGHSIKVVLESAGRRIVFYARHINRLSDDVVNLNDGNPLHKIQVRSV